MFEVNKQLAEDAAHWLSLDGFVETYPSTPMKDAKTTRGVLNWFLDFRKVSPMARKRCTFRLLGLGSDGDLPYTVCTKAESPTMVECVMAAKNGEWLVPDKDRGTRVCLVIFPGYKIMVPINFFADP